MGPAQLQSCVSRNVCRLSSMTASFHAEPPKPFSHGRGILFGAGCEARAASTGSSCRAAGQEQGSSWRCASGSLGISSMLTHLVCGFMDISVAWSHTVLCQGSDMDHEVREAGKVDCSPSIITSSLHAIASSISVSTVVHSYADACACAVSTPGKSWSHMQSLLQPYRWTGSDKSHLHV